MAVKRRRSTAAKASGRKRLVKKVTAKKTTAKKTTAKKATAKKATAKKATAKKAAGASTRGLRAIKVTMPKSGEVQLYASARVAAAFKEVFSEDQPLYQSVRIAQIVEAAYQQGQKDGARRAFEEMDQKMIDARQAVPHKNPGRPRKSS